MSYQDSGVVLTLERLGRKVAESWKGGLEVGERRTGYRGMSLRHEGGEAKPGTENATLFCTRHSLRVARLREIHVSWQWAEARTEGHGFDVHEKGSVLTCEKKLSASMPGASRPGTTIVVLKGERTLATLATFRVVNGSGHHVTKRKFSRMANYLLKWVTFHKSILAPTVQTTLQRPTRGSRAQSTRTPIIGSNCTDVPTYANTRQVCRQQICPAEQTFWGSSGLSEGAEFTWTGLRPLMVLFLTIFVLFQNLGGFLAPLDWLGRWGRNQPVPPPPPPPPSNDHWEFHTHNNKVFFREKGSHGGWTELPSGLPQPQNPSGPQSILPNRAFQHPGGPQGPVEPEFQFDLRPLHQQSIPIDPILLAQTPLPLVDLAHPLDPATIAARTGHAPADKVGGRRVVNKCKKRSRPSDSEAAAAPKAKRGRKAGTPNFKPHEIKKLLTILCNRLPAGGKGWSQVSTDYNGWAKRKGLPECDQWSLEAKYKAILKTKKPMGSASRPAFVTDALEVEDLINQHVGARDDDNILSILSDSSDSDSDSNSDNDGPAVTAVARRAPSPPLRGRKPRTSGPELVNTIAYALGPEASKAWEDARNKCSYENTHIFSLSQQLDRLQTENSALRTQVSDLQRALDRAELCLEFQTTALDNNSRHYSYHPRRHGRVHGDAKKDTYYGFQRVHGRIRVEEKFPDGGAQSADDVGYRRVRRRV
ncbi:hypothetical protein C8F01DRAFT_1236251 [Mycena amicta]|nr:hypothetical protein C8F01DRAFT_1236251 [Mycena amicta]